MLNRSEVRRFYDHFGSRQDSQAWYEDAALAVLLKNGRFHEATRVFELGCGTGRFAAQLFQQLPDTADYVGHELSPVMAGLSRERLKEFSPRAQIVLTEGSLVTGYPDESFDRVVANFVLDLLPESEIAEFVTEARRILVPDGLFCVANLCPGRGMPSILVSKLWALVHRIRPSLVGGCRPLEVSKRLSPKDWSIEVLQTTRRLGVSVQALVGRVRK